jgi:hypothetical protein
VLDGRGAADEGLGGAELEQDVDTLTAGGRFRKSAAQVDDGAVGGAARERAARRLAERYHDLGIRGRCDAKEVCGYPFRLRPCLGE